MLAAAAPAGAARPAWRPDVAAARAFAADRPGTVAFGVRTACGRWTVRGRVAMPQASLLKPLLLVTHLRGGGVRDRPLTRADRALLGPMIRSSANDPASRLVVRLGEARLEAAARRFGMRSFALLAPWGLSPTTVRDQLRLWQRIDDRIPRRHRAYALRLLRSVIPRQRWGLGRVVPRGWTLHLKGGWGSGTGLVDHQSALLVRGRERVALSVLTRDNGSHPAGKATLRGVGARLLRGLGTAQRLCGP